MKSACIVLSTVLKKTEPLINIGEAKRKVWILEKISPIGIKSINLEAEIGGGGRRGISPPAPLNSINVSFFYNGPQCKNKVIPSKVWIVKIEVYGQKKPQRKTTNASMKVTFVKESYYNC